MKTARAASSSEGSPISSAWLHASLALVGVERLVRQRVGGRENHMNV